MVRLTLKRVHFTFLRFQVQHVLFKFSPVIGCSVYKTDAYVVPNNVF